MYIYMDIALHFSCSACGKCCRNDWQVTVDEESYRRNGELFATLGKQSEFQQAFIPLPAQKHVGEYAAIAKKATGGCCFLTADNLCSLQQQAGHTHLDAVCQTYPRYPMNTSRGLELTLSFSCPTVLQRACRPEPLTVIRAEHPPMDFIPATFTMDVFPQQQPAFSPLRYYFEFEQHFMDILQCRGRTMGERIALIKETIKAFMALGHDDDFNRKLTELFYRNYELLDTVPNPAAADVCTADMLLEHFLVNFVFKKPFYTYGLQRGLMLLEHIWQYVESRRRQSSAVLTDMELTKEAIMEVELQYGHNRSALLQHIQGGHTSLA